MVFDLLVWWYSKGWLRAWQEIPLTLQKVLRAFTLPVLLRTLFSPWKQIIAGGGSSIDEKFRAMVDNLVSRTIGFFVRLGVLLAALVIMVIAGIVTFVLALAWPAVPLLIFYCLFRGIAG